jgi:hypothetical protein
MKRCNLYISVLSIVLLFGISAVSAQTVGIFDQQADWGPRGTNKVPGSASFSNGVYTIEGNGDDIWNNDDEGFFLYTEMEGSNSISGKVKWDDYGDNEWSKIVLMVRDNGAEAGSKTYYANLRGGTESARGDRSDAAWRDNTNGSSGSVQIFKEDGTALTQDANGELWMRVSYDAVAQFGQYEYSLDGTNWVRANMHPIVMDSPNAYGIAVTNHNDTTVLARALVSDVVLQEFEGAVFGTHSVTGPGNYDVATFFKTGDVVEASLELLNTQVTDQSVTVVETLPDGWTVSDVSDGGTVSGNTVTWNITVPAGAPGTKTLSFKATATANSANGNFNAELDGTPLHNSTSVFFSRVSEAVGIFDSHMDIGSVGVAGSAEESDGIYSMSASGSDIWGTGDQMHFTFKEMTGAFRIRGWVMIYPLAGDGTWVKGGLMVRDNLTAGSPNLFFFIRNSGQIRSQLRPTQGAESVGGRDISADSQMGEVEIERVGNVFNLYYLNMSGESVYYDTIELPMEDPVYVGLALTSHNNSELSEMDVEEVELEEYPFAVSRVFNSTNLLPGDVAHVSITVDVREGQSTNFTLEETISSGITISNVNASVGTPVLEDGKITWTGTGVSGTAELTYDIETPVGQGIKFSVDGFATGPNGLVLDYGKKDLFVYNTPLSDFAFFTGTSDVGDVGGAAGLAGSGGTSFMVAGSGADIWGTADGFHYLYRQVSGDFEIQISNAEIGPYGSNPSYDEWQKMGIMVRQTLDNNSPYIYALLRSLDQNYYLQWRDAVGIDAAGSSVTINGADHNKTLILRREGDVFSAYYQDVNGEEQLNDSHTLAFTDPVYLGIAVTSHQNGALSAGTFTVDSFNGAPIPVTPVEAWMLY